MTKPLINKILIIVPHPDDEINIAGQLIASCKKKDEIYILVMTNGDYIQRFAFQRMKECIEAMSMLGVPEKNIFFMGYGNEYKYGKNLYDSDDEEVLVSIAERNETYSLPEKSEIGYLLFGEHSKYTRRNLKRDLKASILYIHADCIISNDYDEHIDHKTLSLIFDETIGEILNESSSYRPIVLKKYAYASCWFGKNDYYKRKSTLEDSGNSLNPTIVWENRLVFDVCNMANTNLLHDNIVYKAAKKYVTQQAQTHMGRVCNSDIVFWQIRTDNLLYKAKLFSSSGNCDVVKDFRRFDPGCINERTNINQSKSFSWKVSDDDKDRSISIHFKEPVNICQIEIIEKKNDGKGVKNIEVIFDDGFKLQLGELNHNGKGNIFTFPYRCNVKKLTLHIVELQGTEMSGITEIGAYSSTSQEFALNLFDEEKNFTSRFGIKCILELIEDFWSETCLRIKNLVWKTQLEGIGYYPKKIYYILVKRIIT